MFLFNVFSYWIFYFNFHITLLQTGQWILLEFLQSLTMELSLQPEQCTLSNVNLSFFNEVYATVSYIVGGGLK